MSTKIKPACKMTLEEHTKVNEDGFSPRNIYGYHGHTQYDFCDRETIGDAPVTFPSLQVDVNVAEGYEQEYDAVSCAGSEIVSCSLCENDQILCSLRKSIKEKEEHIASLEDALEQKCKQLEEKNQIIEENEGMRKELIESITDICGWEMEALDNDEILVKLRNEFELLQTEMTSMKLHFDNEQEQKLLEREELEIELEKMKASYLLIASELEKKKEHIMQEMEKSDKIMAENLLLKREIEEMEASESNRTKYEKLDNLKKQLSMSEETVRALVNILEGKDKLLEALMTNKMPKNNPDKKDIKKELRRQLKRIDLANRTKMEIKEREVIDLKAKLAASEIRLLKAKAFITDMKKKSENSSNERKFEEQDLDRSFRTSSRKTEYSSISESHPSKGDAGTDKNDSTLTLMKTDLEFSQDETYPGKQRLKDQENSKFNNSTNEDNHSRLTETKFDWSKISSCTIPNEASPLNEGPILCHKTELNLPVTVQLVIEKSENMKKIFDVLKGNEAPTRNKSSNNDTYPDSNEDMQEEVIAKAIIMSHKRTEAVKRKDKRENRQSSKTLW